MHPSSVILIVGPRGSERSALLARSIAACEAGSYVHLLETDKRTAGVWSGVSDLIEDWARWAETAAPEILKRHRYELESVSPDRRVGPVPAARSLAETVASDERIRVLPSDRAHRIAQGLIDFLLEAARLRDVHEIALGCDGYDQSSRLARFFFSELLRRRGDLRLVLVLSAEPAGAPRIFQTWSGEPIREVLQPPLARDPEPDLSPDQAFARASQTAEALSRDPSRAELVACQLIEDWRHCGETQRAFRAQVNTLALYNQNGFYQDALEIVDDLAAHLDDIAGADEAARLSLLVQFYLTLVAAGQPTRALSLLEQQGAPRIHEARFSARVHYMLAMLHVRFLPQRDAAAAERHLLLSIEQATQSEAPEEERQFGLAFALNGLALVRLRQGRPAEALELCQDSLERIENHFSQGRHTLFRSVLIYNIAQVHAGMQSFEKALAHYTAAIALDPNYSEYYNERGSLLLRLGRHEEAAADYRRALSLSPPSAETFTNLGQCYRLMGDNVQAVEAYTRAIDLGSDQILPRVGRAQTLRALGRLDEACQDYGAALRTDPAQPLVWANRAAIHYASGRPGESLADLNEAIRQAPGVPDLYRNRALALAALGLSHEAARDEQTALRLTAGTERAAS